MAFIPGVTDCEPGETVSEKSGTGAGLTVRPTVVVCERLPLAPVMVTVEVPAGVEVLVETVSVDEPEPATEGGLKLAIAEAGKPLAVSATVPLNPEIAPIFTV